MSVCVPLKYDTCGRGRELSVKAPGAEVPPHRPFAGEENASSFRDAEQRAIMLATAKMGPGYHYFVTSISYADDRGSAEVLAYDDRAVRTVKVEW